MFNIPNKIDLLLGAEVYCQIITEGLMRGPPGTPIAQNTRLGWILSGQASCDRETNTSCTIASLHTNITNEEFNLKQFWELESDNFTLEKQLTPDEKRCEEIFQETTKRDDFGRYIVKLPFKEADPSCKYGNSREIALKRFLMLERRFIKSPHLKSEYTHVISEYLQLGHMEEVPTKEIKNPTAVYLPYHEVVREDKKTTKFRILFNASNRDNNGVSLNSNLLVGPTLQSDLRHILMRWRLHPICLTADIVKMYRQIKVTEQDADYQRLLWRENNTQEIRHLRLVRVTFGTASAPYLAVRTLHQVAYDEGNQFQLAASRVIHDFYMDDLLTGCQTVAEGKQIFLEMNKLLEKGGFELQKWSSNNDELLNEISKGNKVTTSNIELKNDEVVKILGLTWNRRTDNFEYSVQLPPISKPVTKRKIISDIGKLFDPMGWLSPAIIKAKIIIQKLWLSGIDWDDELPSKLLNEWTHYRKELIELTKFRIPRWINFSETNNTTELHGFCDASNEAYAAVVYMRIVDNIGNVNVHLLTAKTRVAPIKQISIPRLELCGAVLLAKLLQEVSAVLKISTTCIHAWTDSTVVLAWLSDHPSRWKTFVANRVSEILNILNRDQWSHISSGDNPADCASRGLNPSEVAEFQQWKSGPAWLKNRSIKFDRTSSIDLEEKATRVYCVIEQNQLELWTKFSSLRKLVRVLAYCRRFIKKLKLLISQFPVWLTSDELNESLNICIKQCQAVNFQRELKDIKDNNKVFKKSKLTSLNPFLDEAGILRVGGRLEQAEIKTDTKHPIILPSKSHLTNLILAETHMNTLHGGPQLMLNYLRSKYWVLDAKNRVKMVVRNCVVCARHAALTRNQLMGQLPPVRVTPIRAFYRSGVDYAGPIQIRMSKGRGMRAYKGYICLFVCMATRAIHLEAVSDLTSQSFIAAFKRFVARRGHCADLYSDNGTNFVGAARELRILFAQEKSTLTKDIAEALANNGTTWHFIPPHSPHFGGLWEAGIKFTKHHLRRVIGNATLTFEELTTLLYQIEACLNSRPLSQISSNSQDPIPLTPAHFLIGEPIKLVPEKNYELSSISSLKRWQLTQKMLQHFWRRWSREYLTQFLHRYKWANKNPEPEIGNLVLVKEDDLPPAKWLLGRIIEKHPGLDDITRVVTLKCKGVLLKRPVTKICVLPITQ
ncbi:uncharacterized protein LOC124532456 [Vanessa cardui]|uniref:uncharacterized protein LOC124532456 n=1 Tax=Vanessa cardui TaxID=171605 RepID=UPI001F12EB6D|nr:uncharacterized protein LOC124532456 [Vanessa cardui]